MRTFFNLGSRIAVAFLVLGGAVLSGACTMDTSELDTSELVAQEGEDQAQSEGEDQAQIEGEDIASTEQAIYSGWTPYTSEEYPPIHCDSASLVNSVQCKGSYCDNIRFYCNPTGGSLGGSYWTSYFSEEGTNYRYCGAGEWVTGLSCTGGWCDNISLQCSYVGNVTPVNCHWTGWVSEEGGGTLSFGAGYYARGVQCSGGNCDNKRFYVCQTGSTAASCGASTCGGNAGGCWCDAACLSAGDCCSNACSACGQCG